MSLAHRFYLWAQRRQAWAKRRKDPAYRTQPYLDLLRQRTTDIPWNQPALCLGPRNWRELHLLRAAGFRDVIGLDLFSGHSDIRVGDMHALPLEDGRFGLIWASHVLEHARVAERVFDEITRVSMEDALVLIAYPTNFRPNWHDRWDYGHPLGRPWALLNRRAYAACLWMQSRGAGEDHHEPTEWVACFRISHAAQGRA